jgi:hypothetical protein
MRDTEYQTCRCGRDIENTAGSGWWHIMTGLQECGGYEVVARQIEEYKAVPDPSVSVSDKMHAAASRAYDNPPDGVHPLDAAIAAAIFAQAPTGDDT